MNKQQTAVTTETASSATTLGAAQPISAPTVLLVKHLSKSYPDGQHQRLAVLQDINLEVRAGVLVAIVGRSGSGKSTLLHLMAGLDQPDQGSVWLRAWQSTAASLTAPVTAAMATALTDLVNLQCCSATQLDHLHNTALGFVFQYHYLLAELTILENILLPARLHPYWRQHPAQMQAKAEQLLAQVELLDKKDKLINTLSGGQKQRVAIARALINYPVCVLADEPTGNLDEQSADQLMALIRQMAHQYGTAFMLVTHDNRLASTMDQTYMLANGHLQKVAAISN